VPPEAPTIAPGGGLALEPELAVQGREFAGLERGTRVLEPRIRVLEP